MKLILVFILLGLNQLALAQELCPTEVTTSSTMGKVLDAVKTAPPKEITFRGEINKYSINRLLRNIDKALEKNTDIIISVDSGGGNVNEAIRAVNRIRGLNHVPGINISTKLTSSHDCESACTILYTAGKKRMADSRAKFGFHSPKYESGDKKGLSKKEVEAKYRLIWLNQVASVDPVASDMVDRQGYLMSYQMSYVSVRELETGYVTDVL